MLIIYEAKWLKKIGDRFTILGIIIYYITTK